MGAKDIAANPRANRMRAAGAREVILWVDTFNNYFHPETAARRSKSSRTPVSQ